LDLGKKNPFTIIKKIEQLGIKTELVVDSILVHLAQGVMEFSLKVALGVKLVNGNLIFFEKFILCDLGSFDAILGNTFLDAYKVDIFHNGNKIKGFVLKFALSLLYASN
jgi:hypothetical protein